MPAGRPPIIHYLSVYAGKAICGSRNGRIAQRLADVTCQDCITMNSSRTIADKTGTNRRSKVK